MTNIEIKKFRLVLIYFLILGIFSAMILRMLFIVSFGDKVKVSGIYDPRLVDKRANIYDRNGVLVATDLKTKSLYVSSVLVKDSKAIARGLDKIFSDLSYKEILKKISSGRHSRKWILIRRNLTPNQVDQVNNLQMAGLLFENDRVRVYLQKSIVSHFVGYVDLDRKGLAGMEREYNDSLTKGQDLQLSLDIRVQDILHDELVNGVKEFSAKAAAGIVMDVNNGEIIALSSLPEFDPNLQNEANSTQRFNRVTNGVYELGSVFKIFTNAMALDHNLIKRDDIYNVKNPIKQGRFTIRDDHHVKDELSVDEILAYSSNIGTVKIAEKIGVDYQKEFLSKIGLLQKVDTNFPGLGRPIYPKKWRPINLFTISYGHGIAVTPLHLAHSVSSVVNGGKLIKPSFLKLETGLSGKRIIKKSTSAAVREMMRKVVQEGTGRKAKVEGYDVGGKTGTAERAEFGGYNKRQTMASFVAAFPMSEPKYLVYVILDRPDYTFNTGGMVAAPVAGRIIKNIAPILGVRPKRDD